MPIRFEDQIDDRRNDGFLPPISLVTREEEKIE